MPRYGRCQGERTGGASPQIRQGGAVQEGFCPCWGSRRGGRLAGAGWGAGLARALTARTKGGQGAGTQ
jgi:hypothetical protein